MTASVQQKTNQNTQERIQTIRNSPTHDIFLPSLTIANIKHKIKNQINSRQYKILFFKQTRNGMIA